MKIVDPDVWAKVQEIKSDRGHASPVYRRRPKHMLSGLLRCGSCGGGMSIKGEDRGGTRIQCTQFHNARTCDNNRTYYLHHIEQTVIGGLRKHLVNPAEIKVFLKIYSEERKRLAADEVNIRSRLERDLAEVTRKLERAMSAMLDSVAPVANFTAAIGALEADQHRITGGLASMAEPTNVVAIHPAAVKRYLAIVDDLAKAIRGGAHGGLSEPVRDLIETVTLNRTEPGKPLDIMVQGRLAALLATPVFPSGKLSGLKW